jgi:multidrug efflux system membrane fusion protein
MPSNGTKMRSISIRILAQYLTLAAGTLAARGALAQTAAPVTATRVMRADVPIYANGIGTVAADQLAQVRAQVDGVIDRIGFTEGQEVKQGDFLAEIDPRPYQAALDQALAKLQSDLAALANARKDQLRDQSLVRTQDVPQQTLDAQNALVAQDSGTVAGDQALVASARINLGFTRITAPIAGRVGLREIDLGNLVHATDATALVTVASVHPISVIFTLPQDQIATVADMLGSGTPATVQALSADGQTQLAAGTLVTADNVIDSSTGTIKLKASFANKDNHLWPGEFVNVKLLTKIEKNVLSVPSAAVQHSPDGPFLYVIGADGKVAARPVTLGPDDGVTVVIATGAAAGELVVTNGASRLSDGTRVQIRSYDGQPGAAP